MRKVSAGEGYESQVEREEVKARCSLEAGWGAAALLAVRLLAATSRVVFFFSRRFYFAREGRRTGKTDIGDVEG